MGLDILIAAGVGLSVALLLIPRLLRWDLIAARQRRASDWHHDQGRSAPRLGGAVLVVAFVAVEIWIAVFHPELRAATPGRNAIITGSLAMFALGFWDDLRPVPAGWKLLGQGVIAAAVCFYGVGIEVWRLPFAGNPIPLGAWGPVLTILWLVS